MTNTGTRTGAKAGDVLLQSLDLLDVAPAAIDDAELVAASIRELTERVNSGIITAAARRDLGSDLLALTENLHAFALRVMA